MHWVPEPTIHMGFSEQSTNKLQSIKKMLELFTLSDSWYNLPCLTVHVLLSISQFLLLQSVSSEPEHSLKNVEIINIELSNQLEFQGPTGP